jgi:hypothetical protein
VKVLQVNSSDIIGSRFNGFDARYLLAEAGIESHHLAWNKLSDDSSSSDIPDSRKATRALARVEARLSVHSRLQFNHTVCRCIARSVKLTSFTIISFTTAILGLTHFPC